MLGRFFTAHRRSIIGPVAAAALVTRATVMASTSGYRPIHDDAAYARTAVSLLRWHRYPMHVVPHVGWQASAYRPPGWPMVLAALWSVTGVNVTVARGLLVVLGASVCVLGAVVGAQLGGRRVGLTAGLLLAFDPLLLAVGATLESESLFIVLVLGALAAALTARRHPGHRWRLAAGALIGAAALTHSNGLLLTPVIACLTLPPGERWSQRGARRAAVALVGAALVIAPWTIRNAVDLHRLVPISTETGNTLAGTYNPASMRAQGRWLEPQITGAYRQVYRRFGAGAAVDPALTRAVIRWVSHHPTYPVYVVAQNTVRLSGFAGAGWAALSLHTMSLGGRAGALVSLASAAVTLLALAALLSRRRRGNLGALGWPAAVLLLSVAPVTGEMRLAAPMQVILALMAATLVADLRPRRPRAGERLSSAKEPAPRP